MLMGVPVWCQYDDGFREPEGDVWLEQYPEIGDELTLCDGNKWKVVAIEGDPKRCWPKVICEQVPKDSPQENDFR